MSRTESQRLAQQRYNDKAYDRLAILIKKGKREEYKRLKAQRKKEKDYNEEVGKRVCCLIGLRGLRRLWQGRGQRRYSCQPRGHRPPPPSADDPSQGSHRHPPR